MTFDWTQGALAEGLHDYNAGNYFTAHEAWESVWMVSPEPEKAFLQGLIQVTAAFHHFQRGNLVGFQRTLEKALRRLDPLPAEFGGIAVAMLRDDIRDRLELLARNPHSPLTPVCIQPR
ncbi:MAG TPA: DUF309 domain-containing protein [Acidobacteriaceae bacterium]